jgi:hypothetical protein
MAKLLFSSLVVVALVQTVPAALAQGQVDEQKVQELEKSSPLPPSTGDSPSEKGGKQEPGSKVQTAKDAPVFAKGVLNLPGASVEVDTAPSTVSARNAASDRLPIAAFRLKHLTDDQRREIAQELLKQRDLAIGPAGVIGDYVVGSEVPAAVALQELAPLPDALVAKFPELRGAGVMRAGGKLVLVDLDNSLVIGVLDG